MIVIIRNYYNQCGRRASTPTIRLSAELFLCATNVRTGQLKRRKTGARLWLPIFLALEAEGHFRAGRDQAALHSIEQALATDPRRWRGCLTKLGDRSATASALLGTAH